MILPNFLIIGAAKSGTTSLYKYLEEHPQVYVSPQKEPRFFAVLSDFNKVVGDDKDQRQLWSDSITTLEEYAALFNGVRNEKAVGEASPIYLWSKVAPKNIKKHLPHVKLIAILRHPVDRAFSHYLHNLKIGFEKNPSFEEALADDEVRHYAEYLPQGGYATLLKRYFNLFPPDQIKIFLYDDLIKSPAMLMCSIYQFLGIEDSFSGNIIKIHNASGISKSRIIENIFSSALYQSVAQKMLPFRIKEKVENFVRQKNTFKPKISSLTAHRLHKYFLDEIYDLQNLIDRDLTPWLEKYATLPRK
jgi:hypothetical protein